MDPFIVLNWWLSDKTSACQCRRHKRCKFCLWVRKIPWSRKWQPTPVFLPGESMVRGAWGVIVHRAAESQTLSPRLYLSSTYIVCLCIFVHGYFLHTFRSVRVGNHTCPCGFWALPCCLEPGHSYLCEWLLGLSNHAACTGSPCFIELCRYYAFYDLKVWHNSVLSKSVGAIFPTAFACSLSLCHILSILAIFQAF